MPNDDAHAERAQTVQHFRLVNVTARYLMTHLAQHLGDGVHARATNANHMNSSWPAQIKKRVATHSDTFSAAFSTTAAIEQLRCTSPSFLAI